MVLSRTAACRSVQIVRIVDKLTSMPSSPANSGTEL